MTEDELTATFPRLWHMAEDGSWPSISARGLLSTAALLDLYEVVPDLRDKLLSKRRPRSVTISKAGLPAAVIRDQKPMSDGALTKCLGDGITPAEWYETLNSKVFFWLSQKRLRKLLRARAYRFTPQTVITLCTASLIAENRKNVLLSPINSGSTIMNPRPRGNNTFLPIPEYPFTEWCSRRSKRDAVVELVVSGGISPVSNHVLAVHRVFEEEVEELWRSPSAQPEDGP